MPSKEDILRVLKMADLAAQGGNEQAAQDAKALASAYRRLTAREGMSFSARILDTANEASARVLEGTGVVPLVRGAIGLGPRFPEDEVLGKDWNARGLELVGTAATMEAGILGRAKAIATAVPTPINIGNIPDALVRGYSQAFEAAPKAITAGELGSGYAAGVGGAIAERTGGNEAVGEVVGGVLGGVTAPSLVAKLSKLYTKVAPGAVVARAIEPWLKNNKGPLGAIYKRFNTPAQESTVDPRAIARIDRALNDGETWSSVAKAADEANPLVPMTVAERSGSPGLIELQKSAQEGSDAMKNASAKRYAQINSVLSDNLALMQQGQIGEETGSAIRSRAMDLLASTAIDDASVAVAAIPKGDKVAAAKTARGIVEKAYQSAKGSEKTAWEQVDLTAAAKTPNLSEQYGAYLREQNENIVIELRNDLTPKSAATLEALLSRPKTAPEVNAAPGTPEAIKQRVALMQYNQQAATPAPTEVEVTVGELKELRSDLLDASRSYVARGDRNKNRIAQGIANAALRDLEAVPGNEAYRAAVGTSKDLNLRFRQGYVGEMLGYKATGETKMAEELSLEKIRGPGSRGAIAADRLLSAADTPELRGAMENYLGEDFARVVVSDGVISPARAKTYLKNHKEVLDRFPALADKLNAAVASSKNATELLAQIGHANVKTILGAADPRLAASQVVETLQRDTTGNALKGFRAEVFDEIVQRATSGERDAAGRRFLSGARLQEVMRDPHMKAAIEGALTPAQQNRLRRIADTAHRAESSRQSAPSMEGVIGDTQGDIITMGQNILAASVGHHAAAAVGSSGNIQIPGMFVRLMNKFRARGLDPAKQLVEDMILAPDAGLFKAWMANRQPGGRVKYEKNFMSAADSRRIRTWLAALAVEHGIDASEELGSDTSTAQASLK